jgi:hypothetical protein
VAEDVAYHFDVGPSINLSGCVAVPKSMRTDYLGRNTRQPSVVPDTIANGRPGHPLVRHSFSQKDVLH